MANRSTNENKGLNKWIDGHQLDYTNTDFSTSTGDNPPEPITKITSASGGNIADAQPMTGSPNPNNPGGNWKYHVWQHPCPAPQSSFVVTTGFGTVEYLVVGGGGGGQGSSGGGGGRGGGGGGGLRTNVPGVVSLPGAPGGSIPLTAAAITCNPGTFAVTIGQGGGASNSHNTPADRGTPSSIAFASGTITADGGGGGFYPEGSPNQGPGGSGGANMNPGPTIKGFGNRDPSNNPTPHQGYPSGNGGGNAAAGGGGAGTEGGNAGTGPTGSGGEGGNGAIVNIAPPSYGTPGPSPGRWFAGGGGGAKSWNQSGGGGAGSAGGGGAGANSSNTNGGAATQNTGGGGGGACGPTTRYGADGAHGIVIVRYQA